MHSFIAGDIGRANASAQTYTISVNQFVEHPALDAVLKGFQDYLKENGVDVKYNIHNAQANMGTASQIAKQMIGENRICCGNRHTFGPGGCPGKRQSSRRS